MPLLQQALYRLRSIVSFLLCCSYRARSYNQYIIQNIHFVVKHTATCFDTEVPSSITILSLAVKKI